MNHNYKRRELLRDLTIGSVALAGGGAVAANAGNKIAGALLPLGDMPSYLKGYEESYRQDPRKAAIEWFRNAKYGLFLHYGIYSQLGRGAWAYKGSISKEEYESLKNTFDPKNFDADFITDLALEAEMKYVNITSKHHDGFSLFKTAENDYNSWDAPCHRDLIGELAESCRRKGLGFFTYYSHGREWRHPYAFNNYVDRTQYKDGQPKPKKEKKKLSSKDWDHVYQFLEFSKKQITELLTNYGPIAGIWNDGWSETNRFFNQIEGGEKLKEEIQKLYETIHELQPQVLVSYKKGLLMTEDFYAPELKYGANKLDTDKPVEYCGRLQKDAWAYKTNKNCIRYGKDEMLALLQTTARLDTNLLLNTGPLADGSIHPDDVKTLREVGAYLRTNGFPQCA